MADAGVRQRLADLGQEIPPREQQTPEALAALPQGRDREMVADHQGRQHQGGVTPIESDPRVIAALLCLSFSGAVRRQPIAATRRRRLSEQADQDHRRLPARRAPDITSRLLGDKLTESAGASRSWSRTSPGAGGNIAVERVAKAAPDGYTLLMATSSAMAINPTLYKKLPYDPVKDFAPIAMLAHLPFILVVNPSLPVNSVADLITYAKERPGQLSFGIGRRRRVASSLRRAVQESDRRADDRMCPTRAPCRRSTI